MSKPRALGHLGRGDELRRAPRPCRRGPSPSAPALRGDHGTADARHHRPVAVGQRRVALLPAELGRALAPGMADLAADLRLGLGMDEIDDPLPRRLMLGRIKARAAGRDAALGRDAGHLGVDQPRAALGALGVMDEMPVGRAAVDRLVLRHRRDDDAVLQLHVAQPERREHRRAARLRRRPAPGTSPRRCRSHSGSRRRRFSWLMRWLRVSSE